MGDAKKQKSKRLPGSMQSRLIQGIEESRSRVFVAIDDEMEGLSKTQRQMLRDTILETLEVEEGE